MSARDYFDELYQLLDIALGQALPRTEEEKNNPWQILRDLLESHKDRPGIPELPGEREMVEEVRQHLE